jgi:hypothetical protein
MAPVGSIYRDQPSSCGGDSGLLSYQAMLMPANYATT